MSELDLPILKKITDFYQIFHGFRQTIPKSDRYTLWQKIDILLLDLTEIIVTAINLPKNHKLPYLEKASTKLTLIKILVRLAYKTKTIDHKKYLTLQENLNEIGKMLGGWLKACRTV